MDLFCVECGAPFPRPKGDARLPEEAALVRLVRGRAGANYSWGSHELTAAPAALVCECLHRGPVPDEYGRPSRQGGFSDCIGKLFQGPMAIIRAFEQLPKEGLAAGWPYWADRCYATEYLLRAQLPKTYELLCGLEARGDVPRARAGGLQWFLPWWREMVAQASGKR